MKGVSKAPPAFSIFLRDSNSTQIQNVREIANDAVLLRRADLNGVVLYTGQPNPDNWGQKNFYKIPDSLSAMLHRQLFQGKDARMHAAAVAYTQNYFTNGLGGTLYYFKDSLSGIQSIDPEPLAPTLLRLETVPPSQVYVDGAMVGPSSRWWITDKSVLEIKFRAPGFYDRVDRILVHPGVADTLHYLLFPEWSDSSRVLESRYGSWFHVEQGYSIGQILDLRRDLLGLKDTLSARKAMVISEFNFKNPRPERTPGEKKDHFKAVVDKWEHDQINALSGLNGLNRRCDSVLTLLENWHEDTHCRRDSLTWRPDEGSLGAFLPDFGTATVTVTFHQFPAWFQFSGSLTITEGQYLRMKNAWKQAVVCKAYLWGRTQSESKDSTWVVGFDELKLSLGSEMFPVMGTFDYPLSVKRNTGYPKTIEKLRQINNACRLRPCASIWACYWPWILGGSALAAGGTGVWIWNEQSAGQDPKELHSYQVNIHFGDQP